MHSSGKDFMFCYKPKPYLHSYCDWKLAVWIASLHPVDNTRDNGHLLICAPELQAMVHVVLLFLVLGVGTVCHWHWICCHCQYDSSVASTRQFFSLLLRISTVVVNFLLRLDGHKYCWLINRLINQYSCRRCVSRWYEAAFTGLV